MLFPVSLFNSALDAVARNSPAISHAQKRVWLNGLKLRLGLRALFISMRRSQSRIATAHNGFLRKKPPHRQRLANHPLAGEPCELHVTLLCGGSTVAPGRTPRNLPLSNPPPVTCWQWHLNIMIGSAEHS